MSATDDLITKNASIIRATQFAQQVKMTAGIPTQIAQAQSRYEASKDNLKKQIETDEVKALLGDAYAGIAVDVAAL